MKMIFATIQPAKVSAARETLRKIEVHKLTLTDAQGYARQRGHHEMYRGLEYHTDLLRKSQFQIVVNEDFLERTVSSIEAVARTGAEGNIGDGKIFVVPVEQVIRISDGARGPGAV